MESQFNTMSSFSTSAMLSGSAGANDNSVNNNINTTRNTNDAQTDLATEIARMKLNGQPDQADILVHQLSESLKSQLKCSDGLVGNVVDQLLKERMAELTVSNNSNNNGVKHQSSQETSHTNDETSTGVGTNSATSSTATATRASFQPSSTTTTTSAATTTTSTTASVDRHSTAERLRTMGTNRTPRGTIDGSIPSSFPFSFSSSSSSLATTSTTQQRNINGGNGPTKSPSSSFLSSKISPKASSSFVPRMTRGRSPRRSPSQPDESSRKTATTSATSAAAAAATGQTARSRTPTDRDLGMNGVGGGSNNINNRTNIVNRILRGTTGVGDVGGNVGYNRQSSSNNINDSKVRGRSRSKSRVRSKSPNFARSRSPFRRNHQYQKMEEDDTAEANNNESDTVGLSTKTDTDAEILSMFHDAHSTEEDMNRSDNMASFPSSSEASATGAQSNGIFSQSTDRAKQQVAPSKLETSTGHPAGIGSTWQAFSTSLPPVQTGQAANNTSNPTSMSGSPQKRNAPSPIDLVQSPKRPEVDPDSMHAVDNQSASGDKSDVHFSTQPHENGKTQLDDTFKAFGLNLKTSPSTRQKSSSSPKMNSKRTTSPRIPHGSARKPSNARFTPTTNTTTTNQPESPWVDMLSTPLSDNGTPVDDPPSATPAHITSSRLSMGNGGHTPELSPLHAVNLGKSNKIPFGSPPLARAASMHTMGTVGQMRFDRRQTAPSGMASGIAAANLACQVGDMSIDDPKTPFGQNSGPTFGGPKSVETSHPKKKDQQSKTPIFETVGAGFMAAAAFNGGDPSFQLGVGEGPSKGRLGKSRNRKQGRGNVKNIGTAHAGIPNASTDDTSPTASDMTGDSTSMPAETNGGLSPSNSSTGDMSVDTPFPSGKKTNAHHDFHSTTTANHNHLFQQNQCSFSHSFPGNGHANGGVPPNIQVVGNGSNSNQSGGFTVGLGVGRGPKTRNQKQGSRRGGMKNRSGSMTSNNASKAPVSDPREYKLALIQAKRARGKQAFKDGNHAEAIAIYTDAIDSYLHDFSFDRTKDLLAVLYSNRAAVLLMVGANEAAIGDCEMAVQYISDSTGQIASQFDVTPLLRPKCYNRHARALLKIGRVQDAVRSFDKVIGSVESILDFFQSSNGLMKIEDKDQNDLRTLQFEALAGKEDACRVGQMISEINTIFTQIPNLKQRVQSMEHPGQVDNPKLNAGLEALSKINDALRKAVDCTDLHVKKVQLLASMKRWREVASHCERYAAANVRSDGCFFGDLAGKATFKQLGPAKILKSDYFDNFMQDDSLESANVVLSRYASAEAVLRLPPAIMKIYVRSLRIEERYDACIECLGACTKSGVVYPWIQPELHKVQKTKEQKELGDRHFRRREYAQASGQYFQCSQIDFENESDDFLTPGKNAGGRLHAVLHSNRVACFMALEQYNDALAECNWALRVHPRYMKVILRKARCYGRMNRYDEAIAEFTRYLDLVKGAKNDPDYFNPIVTPCVLDLPQTVSSKDFERAKEELSDVKKEKINAREKAAKAASYHNEKWKNQRSAENGQRNGDYFRGHRGSSYNSGDPGRNSYWGASSSRGFRPGEHARNASQDQRQRQHSQRGAESNRSSSNIQSTTSACHYAVLGVSPTATDAVIKKAYRKLALKNHPDKGGDPEAFKRISEANQVLSSPTRRRTYDRERLA